MRRFAKALILLLLLAVLPLRGYAGAVMALCEATHGGTSSALEHAHEHGGNHPGDSNDGAPGPSPMASACSYCASCCAGASLAPDADHSMAFPAPGTDRIPFYDRRISGVVPEHLDRPPLPL